MTDVPAPRWWRRRRDLALAAARQAQGRAAIALLELDTAQRSAFSHLDFLASVDAGAIGHRIRLAWAPVSAAADAAIHAYLEALERWDVSTDLVLEEASAAATAFAAHAGTMTAVLHDIDAFSDRFTADFISVTRSLDQLASRRRVAEDAVEQAASAVAEAESDGLVARRARGLLDQALAHLQVVQEGPVARGMDTVLQACGDAVAAAHEAAHDVEKLPELRRRVQTSVSAVRTRLAALEWRYEQGSEAELRVLRRGYVQQCWQDLEAGSQQARAALAQARRELAAALTAASDAEQRWEDARGAITRSRASLAEAELHVDGPRHRLALLERVSADPQALYARARFAVRDAQKLLMAGPVDPQHARALDALAGRLDATLELRAPRHPDWLAYAHGLDAIVDEAHGLVVDIRAARAR